ncbi:M20/M25/M40 family metallo-hydrolase [Chloroflexia bacterium SDU3-3]|nr:M20/M25/M40 family metallo-hydrolase [Chloroflexia bacterium SDU3-3]
MASELHDDLVRLTCDLMLIPSVADSPEQLRAAIDYAEEYARAIPGVFLHRGEYGGKPHLVATLRDTKTPALFLNAHLDVVPGRPAQFTPELRDGRIYGRASQDMKGSGAVLLRLLRDLAALPERPDVGFQFVSDEEIGGDFGTGTLAAQGWDCQFFLAAEPTDLEICYAHKGVLWVEVELHGTPAHGSRPWAGANALAELRDGLVAMERRYPTPDEAAWLTTSVPTLIQGGEASNRLPERVLLTLDVRHIPDETPEQVVAALQECFPTAEVRLVRSGPPLDTAPDHPLVQRLAAAVEGVTGKPAGFYREHFSTDARFYSAKGTPAVCLGPVGYGLHSDEEWVEIDSLVQLYHALAAFARTF